VRPSSAVGLDGHQWNLRCALGARLPCRALCECGWTSTAGQRTEVLLELRGHLEETLKRDTGLGKEQADKATHRGSVEQPGRPPGAHEWGGDHDNL
jgi:hypothetical protein